MITAGKFKFTVNELGEVGYIQGLSIPSSISAPIGGEGQTLTATLGEGITGTVMWKSADENKVTVSDGVVTAIASSETPVKVTATIKDLAKGIEYSGECLVSTIYIYNVSFYKEIGDTSPLF